MPARAASSPPPPLLTSAGLVLSSIYLHPDWTARQIGLEIGMTERTALVNIQLLREAKLIRVRRIGRGAHRTCLVPELGKAAAMLSAHRSTPGLR